VVVLGQAGEVRGICGKASDFKAVDLGVTELDNIIVLDIYSGLHVINSKRKIIKYQKLSGLGVREAARSLDIDNNGMLLIGCEGRNNDAKIHVVYHPITAIILFIYNINIMTTIAGYSKRISKYRFILNPGEWRLVYIMAVNSFKVSCHVHH
jgi:hypothetical protein